MNLYDKREDAIIKGVQGYLLGRDDDMHLLNPDDIRKYLNKLPKHMLIELMMMRRTVYNPKEKCGTIYTESCIEAVAESFKTVNKFVDSLPEIPNWAKTLYEGFELPEEYVRVMQEIWGGEKNE